MAAARTALFTAQGQAPAPGARAEGGPAVPAATAPRCRVAYLLSQYPALRHTFMLREVAALRALGVGVETVSICAPDRPLAEMTAEERREAESTFYVKPLGVAGALGWHAAALARRPGAYLRALAVALRLAGASPRRLLSYLFYFAEAVVVAEWMRRRGLGHFHTHYSSTVGLIAARAYPVTMSATLHGEAEFNDPAGFHLAEKVEASRFVCAVSRYGRAQMMRHAPHEHWPKLEVAPLGVDPRVFSPRPFRERPAPFEVICVGGLAPVKAHHVLVDAVARLAREGREVRLRLVGDGPEREGLEREVAARGLRGAVVFEGWQNPDRVRELYARADAFALASFAEGVPVVLMEAMATEVPCVATRITGVPELIRDGVDGLLVTPSDAGELAAAIARLMDDPELRLRIGRAGRRRVLERYDLEANVERLAAIFRSRLAGPEAARDGAAAGGWGKGAAREITRR